MCNWMVREPSALGQVKHYNRWDQCGPYKVFVLAPTGCLPRGRAMIGRPAAVPPWDCSPLPGQGHGIGMYSCGFPPSHPSVCWSLALNCGCASACEDQQISFTMANEAIQAPLLLVLLPLEWPTVRISPCSHVEHLIIKSHKRIGRPRKRSRVKGSVLCADRPGMQ